MRPDYRNENEMVESSGSSSADQIQSSTIDPPSIPLAPTQTNCSNLVYEAIPLSERRGILARFAIIPEVRYPTAYPRRTKWMITTIVSLCGATGPMGSAIVMPALLPIARDFHATTTVTNLSVALYMLAMSFFPLWWSSFSETLGRRTIYILSFAMFVLFGVLAAVANSIGMLVAMRLLSGGAAASVQAVGAGSIADIWEPKERGRAMGMFYIGPLCGPLFSPIIGGVLTESLGWRSTQWFLVIFGAIVLVALVFVMPETLRMRSNAIQGTAMEAPANPQIDIAETGEAGGEKDLEVGNTTISKQNLSRTTTRQSVKIRAGKWVALLKRFFVDPLKIVLLLRFPVVAVTVFYASVSFGTLYFLNISIEDSFARPPYNFSTTIIGLMYIPNSLGYLVASVVGGPWLDYIMKREARRANRVDEKGKLIYRPEDRMRENALFAAVCFPSALIWYGWTIQKGVYWIVPVREQTSPPTDQSNRILRPSQISSLELEVC